MTAVPRWRCARCSTPDTVDSKRMFNHVQMPHWRCACGKWTSQPNSHVGAMREPASEHRMVEDGLGELWVSTMTNGGWKRIEDHPLFAGVDPSQAITASGGLCHPIQPFSGGTIDPALVAAANARVDALTARQRAAEKRSRLQPPVERLPYVGFRCWRVYPQQPVLMPIVDPAMSMSGTPWLPGRERVYAECTAGAAHIAPARGCKCGIWALNDLWEVIERCPPVGDGIAFHWQKPNSPGYAPLMVLGVVELTGQLIRGDEGARGEYAQPIALWMMPNASVNPAVFCQIADALQDLYDLRITESWQALVQIAEDRRAMHAFAASLDADSAESEA